MTKSSEILSIDVRHSNADGYLVAEFSVEPPLTEEEIEAIKTAQASSPVLDRHRHYRPSYDVGG